MKKVTVIEAINKESEAADNRKIRVCAYCRVSSMHKEQQNSFEAQVSHYTKYIQSMRELVEPKRKEDLNS